MDSITETLLSGKALTYLIYILPTFILIHLTRQYFYHGLHQYPGPILAKFSNVWRFLDARGFRPERTHIRLHRQHGDIVRLGPNVLSFSSPDALKVIYGLNKGFVKSSFYPVQMTTSKGRLLPSLFSTLDETFHANFRRCVNHAFSMSSIVQYEPLVDETTKIFLDQTDKLFASTNNVCDFSHWLQFYAFDAVGSITYSKRHGFIEKNQDIDGITAKVARIFDYAAQVGQMPWLDKLFFKNPILLTLSQWGIIDNSFPVAIFARERMQERLTNGVANTVRDDLLMMFLKAKNDRPDFMTERLVLTMATSITFAGSDTTAISLSAVFYYLLKSPQYLERLREEIQTAIQTGTIENHPSGLVSWAESQRLPYLDACIKEAFRIHPAAGLPLERVVPPQGMEIDGHWVPGGTIVGCSAWVIHRREDIFGSDVDAFKPERWLEASREQLKLMNGNMFQFGAGSRTCIGKNISLMEVYKLVPSFLRRFDIHLAVPDSEWRLHNAWFVRQLDFNTRFTAREITA